MATQQDNDPQATAAANAAYFQTNPNTFGGAATATKTAPTSTTQPTGLQMPSAIPTNQTPPVTPTLANGQQPGSPQTGTQGLQMPQSPTGGLQMPANASNLVYDPVSGTNVTPEEAAFNATKASGQKPPENFQEAQKTVDKATQQATPPQAIDTSKIEAQLAQDPGYQQLLADQQQYNSVVNQQQSLTQTYTDLSSKLGLPALDTQLINAKAIIDGSEDDIRTEIQKSGGFATNSQVMALANSRNKQLIANYNNLLQTKTNAENTLNTMMGLAEKDKANALQAITQKMQIDQQINSYRDKFINAAKEAYTNVVNAVGYGGLLASLGNDPNAIAGAENSLGLNPGELEGLVNYQQAQTNLATLQAAGGVSAPFVNVNGEIWNSKTGEAYSDPASFFKAAGVSSFEEANKKGLIAPMPVSLDTQMKQAQLETEKAQQANIQNQIYRRNNPIISNPVPTPTTGNQSISNDVQAILEGRNTMYNIRQTMGRTNAAAAYMQQVRDQITAIDPQFDFVASDAGGKSVSTQYVQRATAAINSVLPNIDKVVELSNQVDRVGVAGVDKLLQAGNIQIGNKKVANFKEAQQLIADEIGVALGAGTVSDMKLQLGFDVTNPSVSQEVFASNMEIVKEFIQNRLEGLQSLRYSSSTVNQSTSGANNYDAYINDLKSIGQ